MQGLLQQGVQPQEGPVEEEEGLAPEDDAALNAATDYVLETLYGENDLSADMAKRFANAKDGISPKELAGIALKVSEAADAATNGEIADENLSMLGMFALSEVASIAEATGAQVTTEALNAALQQMIVMFLEDQGVDATPIAEAFAQVDDRELAQFQDQAVAEAQQQPQQQEQQEVPV